MNDMIEALRVAVADGATAEQKVHGAIACRAILAALDAEPGKPIMLPGAPTPNPLANIDPSTALDLLIAKLTTAIPKDDSTPDPARSAAPDRRALRIAFVAPPAQSRRGPARRKS